MRPDIIDFLIDMIIICGGLGLFAIAMICWFDWVVGADRTSKKDGE